MNITKYLQLIRYKNLLLIALMQLMIRYGFLVPQQGPLGLSQFSFVLLIIATLAVAAGGYIINDIFDQNTDAINKPHKRIVGVSVSESQAYSLYAGLTIVGVGIGFYLANSIERPNFAAFFIIIAASLYYYATTLKPLFLIGNFVVALILASSILIVGIFDLLPVTDADNQAEMRRLMGIVFDYALLGFFLHLLREIVKDLEDYEGDWNQGMRTMAIQLGVTKTTKAVALLTIIPIALLLYYTITYFLMNDLHLIAIYCLTFVLAPMCFFAIKIWNASTKKEFATLSTFLKWIVFFGIFILPILDYTVKHHA